MIVDLLVDFLDLLIMPVVGLLPQGNLGLPDATGLASALSGLDGILPILGVLRLGAVMLAALGVFLIVRVVVFLRYLLLP